MTMKIFFAADHAGFEMKNILMQYMHEQGFSVEDKGAYAFDADDDYPDFVSRAAQEVSKNPHEAHAVVIGGSGQGEAMVANRFQNVRAAVYYGDSLDIVRLSREHNNANILSLGARFLNEEDAKSAVKLWLETSFTNEERHVRRINKIDLEK